MLWKRCRERSLLASWDEPRKRNTVRRHLGGVRGREVLHFRVATLLGGNTRDAHLIPGLPAEDPADVGSDSAGGTSAGAGNHKRAGAERNGHGRSAPDGSKGRGRPERKSEQKAAGPLRPIQPEDADADADDDDRERPGPL